MTGQQNFVIDAGPTRTIISLSPYRLSLKSAMVVSKKLVKSIRALNVPWDGKNLKITMSFGVGQYQSGSNVDTFIQQVDDALYKAKHLGRDRVEAVSLKGIVAS